MESDPSTVNVQFEPAVAPELPGHVFAYSYRPAAAGDTPHLFVPLGYPQLRVELQHNALCDHTGREERRQRFVVLRSFQANGYVQVSEGALADYLGDPVAAAMLLLWLSKYERLALTVRESTPRFVRDHFPAVEVVETALEMIRTHGWVSRGMAHETGEISTAGRVLDRLEGECVHAPEPADTARAAEIVTWLEETYATPADLSSTLTDYLLNLSAVAVMEYVEPRHVGLLCSAPKAYDDWRARKEVEARTPTVDPGKHYGVEDSRVEADVMVDRIEDRGENEWGRSLLVHMHVVPTGERVKWWTGEGLKFDEGKQYHVRMTIKKHGEWDGVKETTVSRVMEYDPPPPKETKKRKAKS